MTDLTTEAPPLVRISVAEALEGLTVGELATIERHYGHAVESEKLSATDLSAGLAWAYERRRLLGRPERPEWPHIEAWTMKQLNAYFEVEAGELDEDRPVTDEGKGDALAAR